MDSDVEMTGLEMAMAMNEEEKEPVKRERRIRYLKKDDDKKIKLPAAWRAFRQEAMNPYMALPVMAQEVEGAQWSQELLASMPEGPRLPPLQGLPKGPRLPPLQGLPEGPRLPPIQDSPPLSPIIYAGPAPHKRRVQSCGICGTEGHTCRSLRFHPEGWKQKRQKKDGEPGVIVLD